MHPWSGPLWRGVATSPGWSCAWPSLGLLDTRSELTPSPDHHVVIRYEGLSSDDELWVPAARVVVALTMAPLAWRKVSRGPAVGTGR